MTDSNAVARLSKLKGKNGPLNLETCRTAGDQREEETGMTEDEMVGWHPRLNAHEFEQTPGDSEGQGSLVCCSPWGCKELEQRLSN